MRFFKENWLLLFLGSTILFAGISSWELIQFIKENFGSFFPQKLERTEWGTLGDLFGGILNPFFALLGLLMLLVTLFQNQRELSLSRKEFAESKDALKEQAKTLKEQRFEDTFFSLLEQHNLTLEKITTNFVQTQENQQIAKRNSIAVELKEKLVGGGIYHRILEEFDGLNASKTKLLEGDVKISQYFRMLYQLLKFIANNCQESTVYNKFSPENLLKTICSTEEKMYTNIVRSFLSEDIYYLLSINCSCTDKDDQFYKYKLLLERYSLLEHMPLKAKDNVNNKLISEIMQHYEQIAFGNNSDYTKNMKIPNKIT